MQIVSYGEKTEKRNLPLDQPTQAFFGRCAHLAQKSFGLLAVGDAENHFVIVTQAGYKHIQASPESTVVGVFQDPGFSPDAGLVELHDDRRTLNFNTGRNYTKQIMISDEEIKKISFSYRSPVFAYQTASGKIVIFSITHRVPVRIIG
jgi:hypothetical protein